MHSVKLLTTLLLLLLTQAAQAQYDDLENPRRWAFDGQLGLSRLSHLSTTEAEPVSSWPDVRNGLLTKLHAEYCLPYTHFSLKAGYEHEELNYQGQDFNSTLTQLMVGGRWYPAPAEWPIQPYTGIDVLGHLGESREKSSMTVTSSLDLSYERRADIRLPRMSVAPMIGADIYLFSSIALQVEYGYRLGLGSRIDIDSRYVGSQEWAHTHGHVNRHALTFGLKFVFPFTFTAEDGAGLFTTILDTLMF
ncbi:MAG: hypothetical protein IJ196_03180 [Prevotella sp.]|nr:hypothetical protein [Prevotella sp.]